MDIFHRVGSKATAQQGLDALYDLLEANPNLPVDALMERTSPSFQSYISKGLDRVRPSSLTSIDSCSRASSYLACELTRSHMNSLAR